MTYRRPWCLLVLAAAVLPVRAARAEGDKAFFFKPNDRVVFLGDSITEQYQYSTAIELYLTTRFPSWGMTFLNAGIGGDTATGGANRFATHVLAEKPSAVTINFGMNDGGYGAFNPGANAQYVRKTEEMLAAAKKAGVRVALVSPNAVDRRVQDRFKLYLETQKEFYAPLRGLAERYGDAFVDQYAVTRAALEKMEADGAKSVIPFGDGFHTASPGGLLMAHAILTGLKAPALVSRAEIDAASGTAKGQKCTVDNVKADRATGVAFDRLDESLPMPVQKDWVSLLPYVHRLADLSDYGLKVTGLADGTYQVLIDGQAAARFTADELAKGVNLGLVTEGPIHAQGQKVFDAINDKNRVVHGRFRGVVMAPIPDWLADVARERKPAELKKRAEEIDARQARIYEMAKPVTRHFEVKRVVGQ